MIMQIVGGEQMATQECDTGKAETMKNLRTEGLARKESLCPYNKIH